MPAFPHPPDGAAAANAENLPGGWTAATPADGDAELLAELLRRHELKARGWAGASKETVLIAVSPRGYLTRDNVALRDGAGRLRGWATAHDRAAGGLVLDVVVDPDLADVEADLVAEWLFGWGDRVAARVGAKRGLRAQQVDSGAFASDDRQHRWLGRFGFTKVRTWWQMSRPVTPEESGLDSGVREGVRIRLVEEQDGRPPVEADLRVVHDILETSFADHFNSHEETFDEFVSRLREDPGHRWDHWWVAEVLDGAGRAEPAGALVGSVLEGQDGAPDGSYVEYIGVLPSARGRGVARSLLHTVIADAAARGRDGVGLEVDADSLTGAEGLYLSMGWTTSYVTESWHKELRLPAGGS